MLDLSQVLKVVNGWTIVAYPKTLCKTYGIPYPTYAAFYRCVPEFNPTTEECSFDNLEDLIKWCQEN